MSDTAELLVAALRAQQKSVATAESCTGGLIGKCITDVAGSSAVYPGGVISYCNAVKHALLGVSQQLLDTVGAVSAQVAGEMAQGVRRALHTDFGVSVTGVAGPGSDADGNCAGLVYIGTADAHGIQVREFHFAGDRAAVRTQACEAALQQLLAQL